MGLQLPPELAGWLGVLGFTWPEADETKLFELGNTWTGFASTLQTAGDEADALVQQVWTENKGADFEALQQAWADPDAAVANLRTASRSCLAAGIGLFIAALVVLALKIMVIVQLIILVIQIAQAIATAIATFGASLLQIPIFKMITKVIVDILVDQAVGALLGG
ncbi:hypothetical protein GCM10010191_67520 [Actinomadura vinacea]|uniref:Outer membrane channel protein CpnT-like N-terminal domain-containing protein n=1 Tax=Actinomadura vinacea TaxID=115336 RepID=A0ABN3JYP8_9ACTN